MHTHKHTNPERERERGEGGREGGREGGKGREGERERERGRGRGREKDIIVTGLCCSLEPVPSSEEWPVSLSLVSAPQETAAPTLSF